MTLRVLAKRPTGLVSQVPKGADMADHEQTSVTIQELLVTTLATSDALAKLLIEKGLITKAEFLQRILEERVTYQAVLNSKLQ